MIQYHRKTCARANDPACPGCWASIKLHFADPGPGKNGTDDGTDDQNPGQGMVRTDDLG